MTITAPRTPSLTLGLTLAVAFGAVSAPAFAAKSCDELKTEITAKLDEKKVAGYTLEIVDADKVGEAKVVGSCDGGKKKITYAKK